MIGRRKTEALSDAELKLLLTKHDPVASPGAAELLVLEHRIMAQIDALPDPPYVAGYQLSPWMINRQWIFGGAAAGVLFVILGFGAGREFGALVSPPADTGALYAAADNAAWTSFIAAPSAAGESDDNAE